MLIGLNLLLKDLNKMYNPEFVWDTNNLLLLLFSDYTQTCTQCTE